MKTTNDLGGNKMKRYKKLVVSLLSVVMVLTSLSGCGRSTSTESSAGGEKATITYAIWDKNQEPGMQAIIDAFMKKILISQ